MKMKLSAIACATLIIFSACTKKEPDYYRTDVKTTEVGGSLPELISYNGGVHKLSLTSEVTQGETFTKALYVDTLYAGFQYRIVTGDIVSEPIEVKEELTELEIEVAPNYTSSTREVRVEVAQCDTQDPKWETVASGVQDCALIRVECEGIGSYWAKGNIDLGDNGFIVAEKMTDAGLMFRHGSKIGVKAEKYSGTAYDPAPVQIALSEITADTGDDPCKLISENFRTPSYAEFYYLDGLNAEDPYFEALSERDGIIGIAYDGSDFFMPMCGAVLGSTGEYDYVGRSGAYWALGANIYGESNMYYMFYEPESSAYNYMFYNDLVGENLAPVRCVLDTDLPTYLSHSCQDGELTDKGGKMDIATNPGGFPVYEVSIDSEDAEEHSDWATDTYTTATVVVPANTKKQPITWKIFVNKIYSGVSFEQPAMKDYLNLISYTPKSSDYQAFTCTLKFDTDYSTFSVTLKGTDGTELTGSGSASAPTVVIEIPENTGSERTFSVLVGGEPFEGVSIVQGAAPKPATGLSVEWSEGYLTVKDGQYVIGAPKEFGMFFKWRSRYAIDLGQSAYVKQKYPGKAYAPAEETIALSDIPSDVEDPCALVAPEGTWFMPDSDMIQELIDNLERTIVTSEDDSTWKWFLFENESEGQIWINVGGQLNSSGSHQLPTSSLFWSATPGAAGKAQYFMASTISNSPKISAGVNINNAMQVRCVRNK